MNNSPYDQFQSCLPKLYRFAFSLTKDANNAKDIYQDTLLKIWELRTEWSNWQNFEAYAMRMIKNAFLNSKRHIERERIVQIEDMPELTESVSVYASIELADLKVKFYNLISKLPPLQRDILHLREIEEMEYKEISQVLNISEAQVKVNLFRGRQYLKSKTHGKR